MVDINSRLLIEYTYRVNGQSKTRIQYHTDQFKLVSVDNIVGHLPFATVIDVCCNAKNTVFVSRPKFCRHVSNRVEQTSAQVLTLPVTHRLKEPTGRLKTPREAVALRTE